MSFENWLAFTLTETALCFAPGPAVLLVLSVGLTRGTVPSMSASLGILTANTMYFALSAAGLAGILLASHTAFTILKWIGAAYLVYLGLKTILARDGGVVTARTSGHGEAPRRTAWQTFCQGALLQAANPKSLLFFGALLPQFVDPTGPVVQQFVILGTTSVVIEFFVLLLYGNLAARGSRFADNPRIARWINRVGGGMLVGAGIGLAALKRAT